MINSVTLYVTACVCISESASEHMALAIYYNIFASKTKFTPSQSAGVRLLDCFISPYTVLITKQLGLPVHHTYSVNWVILQCAKRV